MLKRLLALPLFVVLAMTGLAAPSQAAAANTTFVTMFGDNNDYIGQNGSWVWRGGDASVTVGGAVDGQVTVGVSGGGLAEGNYFSLDFAAAPGETLTTGFYDNAERAPFRSAGHPGLDVSGSGRGCNTLTGHFTVLDIAADLSRLHIVYEQHCEGGSGSTFGEVRYNEPGGDSDLLVAPDRIDWPDHFAGSAARNVPVTLVNTGASPVTVSGASITAGGTAFKVASNGCTTIAVGGNCKINVGFNAPTPADYTGTLTITDNTAAGTHTVALAGTGTPAPPNVTITTPKRQYVFGESIVLTAKLTGTYTSKTISFYRTYSGGARQLIATRQVDGTGKATLTLPARENATFSADWAEGELSDTASVYTAVRAKMTLAMARFKRKSGSTYIYSPGANIVTRATLLPAKANRCVYFKAQVKVNGVWRLLATTDCVRTTAGGVAAAYLPYSKDLLGRPLRFNARFTRDSYNTGLTTGWQLAKYVR